MATKFVIGVHLEDMLETGTSVAVVQSFFTILASLSMKDISHVHKILGMRVKIRSNGAFRIDQEEAIKELLHAQRQQARAVVRRHRDQVALREPDVIRAVLEAIHCRCGAQGDQEDYAMQVIHWELAKCIARYLKDTAALKLEITLARTSRDALQLKDQRYA
uniref:Uncharacterized protein n=1 Tax=Peronospora matthiolae TaxID=2874970 RepID=A0AAV1TB44_9STRA